MSEKNIQSNPTSGEDYIEIMAKPENGTVSVRISDDKMEAYITITEERNGGDAVTFDDIVFAVNNHGITDADLEAARALIENKRYDKAAILAKGKYAQNGRDGAIQYLFETTNELAPKKGKLGEVDYKNLGLVRNITEGEVIAVISHPTEGIPGVNVLGQEIPPAPGKNALFVIGQGTAINEEETEIRAAKSGNLIWQKNCFVIEETLVIKEDVDVSTGNIDFIGAVLVKGNISENFIVKSKKSVTVNGTATNATIIADGDINIALGSINSEIISAANVKLGFCESSKIECKGNFSSQSVIAGEIFCGGVFNATQNRGVVYGGKHTALGGFSANIIGSESYAKTQITLGNSAVLAEEKLELTKKTKDLEERTRKLLQVAELLQEQKKNTGQLSTDREAMLTTAIRSRFTFQREIKELNSRIVEIDKELESAGEHYVIVHKNIWPGVTVRIGNEVLIVDRQMSKIMIGKNEEGALAYLPFTKPSS